MAPINVNSDESMFFFPPLLFPKESGGGAETAEASSRVALMMRFDGRRVLFHGLPSPRHESETRGTTGKKERESSPLAAPLKQLFKWRAGGAGPRARQRAAPNGVVTHVRGL